jgi:hypothetical protein
MSAIDEHTLLRSGSLGISPARELLALRSAAGAFERDGALARDTTRTSSMGIESVPQRLPNVEVVDVRDEEVIWGADLIRHYGHFLVESAGRLWPLVPNGTLEGLPVVFRAPPRDAFAKDWLEALDIESIFLPKDGAVRFRRMFVPEPSWRIGGWIAPELRDTHQHARRNLAVPTMPRHDVVWLSRSKLQGGRVAFDERLLEWMLGDRVTTVSPETMSLCEQIGLYESSRMVVGVTGSAFHTLLLTLDTPDCLYLCSESVKSPYRAQHRLLHGTAVFAGTLRQAAHVPRVRREFHAFPAGHRLLIPETLKALNETAIPGLLEDPRLAAFAEPERCGRHSLGDEFDLAVLEVLREPASPEARRRLAAMFEEGDPYDCATEQLAMGDELLGIG